jgi:hypothetical protein
MIPCVYALLTKKSEKAYKQLINQLKSAALSIQCVLNSMNALKYHFPEIKLIGCFFHMGKNFYRHVVDVGLKVMYSKDADFRLWAKMLISLALIPKELKECVFHQTNLEYSTTSETNSNSNE